MFLEERHGRHYHSNTTVLRLSSIGIYMSKEWKCAGLCAVKYLEMFIYVRWWYPNIKAKTPEAVHGKN